jgi:hypothetical protein
MLMSPSNVPVPDDMKASMALFISDRAVRLALRVAT